MYHTKDQIPGKCSQCTKKSTCEFFATDIFDCDNFEDEKPIDNTEVVPDGIANILHRFRCQKGYSRNYVAKKTGYGIQQINTWEHGQAIPQVPALLDILDFYGYTITYRKKGEE